MTGHVRTNIPIKPWGKKGRDLPGYAVEKIYELRNQLDRSSQARLGMLLKVPVYIQDPLVALENPSLGIQEIEIRLELGIGGGPTSARIAVVDFNGDTQTLIAPIIYDEDIGWFKIPREDHTETESWLPDAPHVTGKTSHNTIEANCRKFIQATITNPYYHQLNAWAIVQHVVEYYEAPQALGRPVPWGFDGHRLLIVPHAGFGQKAFYDWHSKSLQFYYYGDTETPGFTCLSHDIISHLTGMAVLDGIRPRYKILSSPQTAAFQEFVGNLTALLLSFSNLDIRHLLDKKVQSEEDRSDLSVTLIEEVGEYVAGRVHLRSAFNNLTMADVQDSLTPQHVSRVMVGTLYQVFLSIAEKHLQRYLPQDNSDSPRVTPARALMWATDRLRRVALQPLDLCPPCDIQFIDYAKAVIRNDILTNPLDEQGYRQAMLDIFHQRQLCTCAYQSGGELPQDCHFQEVLRIEDLDFIYLDIGSLTGSKTAAYYFLNDNHKILHIPTSRDITVVDLYDNDKLGTGAERLSRQFVLIYTWQEEVKLSSQAGNGLEFGEWEGKTLKFDCGGTLVFDERGNLLSWFRKPGTEHLTESQAQDILARKEAWGNDPEEAKQHQLERPSRLELGELHDWEIGKHRKFISLAYISSLIQRNLVGRPNSENRFLEDQKPVNAIEKKGFVHFEITPHLRDSNFDENVKD